MNDTDGMFVAGGGLLLVLFLICIILVPLIVVYGWYADWLTFEAVVIILLLFAIYSGC